MVKSGLVPDRRPSSAQSIYGQESGGNDSAGPGAGREDAELDIERKKKI